MRNGKMTEANCDVCGSAYTKKKKNQRYCSRECYVKAWPINNREKHNERQRQKRAKNPSWYAAREPGYQETYRAKILSKRPWHYLLLSREHEAQRKGLAFELTNEWAQSRWTGCCEITGIGFRIRGK